MVCRRNKSSSGCTTTKMTRRKYGILLVLLNSCFQNTFAVHVTLVANTLSEFRALEWKISGSTPQEFLKPGDFKMVLRSLDAGVTGGGTWRVTSPYPTVFSLNKFTDGNTEYCDVTNARIYIRYFSDSAVMGVSPCVGRYFCYLDPPTPGMIRWQDANFDIDINQLLGAEIAIPIQVPIGGYVFFNQIAVQFEGIDCLSATTETPTTEDPTTEVSSKSTGNPTTTEGVGTEVGEGSTFTTESPSTEFSFGTEIVDPVTGSSTNPPGFTTELTSQFTETSTEYTTRVSPTEIPSTTEATTEDSTGSSSTRPTDATPELTTEPEPPTTTHFPECPTVPPEPCNCCDRCPQKQPQEIHHHHYYYYPSAPSENDDHHSFPH